nr:hypothetical protein [Synechococcus sp. PCC 7502]
MELSVRATWAQAWVNSGQKMDITSCLVIPAAKKNSNLPPLLLFLNSLGGSGICRGGCAFCGLGSR